MKVIRFQRSCAPYHAGERAGFEDHVAAIYVAKGIAIEDKDATKSAAAEAQRARTKAGDDKA